MCFRIRDINHNVIANLNTTPEQSMGLRFQINIDIDNRGTSLFFDICIFNYVDRMTL